MNMHMTKPSSKSVEKAEAPTDTFADTLRALMLKQRISASDLARSVWGTTTDKRGYEVARNRDRIGHYLSGASYPGKENLAKIAKALSVKLEVLEKAQPAPVVRTAEAKAAKDFQVSYADGVAIVSMIKMRLSSPSVVLIMDIVSKDPLQSKNHYLPKDVVQSSKAKKSK
jgi:transcriptional regulator with XRE-family HTH domain